MLIVDFFGNDATRDRGLRCLPNSCCTNVKSEKNDLTDTGKIVFGRLQL